MDGQRYRVLISDKAPADDEGACIFPGGSEPAGSGKAEGIPDGRYTKPGTDAGAMLLIWMKKIGGVHIENCIYPSGIWLYHVVVDDTVYVEYIVDARQEYGWLLR